MRSKVVRSHLLRQLPRHRVDVVEAIGLIEVCGQRAISLNLTLDFGSLTAFDRDGMGHGHGGIGSVLDAGPVSLLEPPTRGRDVHTPRPLRCTTSAGLVVVIPPLGQLEIDPVVRRFLNSTSRNY